MGWGDIPWKLIVFSQVADSLAAPSHAPATSQVADEDDEELAAEVAAQQAEAERIEREQEAERTEKARKKLEAQKRAKEAAASAEAERKRRKDAAAARVSPPPASYVFTPFTRGTSD